MGLSDFVKGAGERIGGNVLPPAVVDGGGSKVYEGAVMPEGVGVREAMLSGSMPWDSKAKGGVPVVDDVAETAPVFGPDELFLPQIDSAMARFLRQKGEGWQLDAYLSWQRGKVLHEELKSGGADVPLREEKERVLAKDRARVQEYVSEHTRRGVPLFEDAVRFKGAKEAEVEAANRRVLVERHRGIFNGDLKRLPADVKAELDAQGFPDNGLGDELRARALVMGWALRDGGYSEGQVQARNGVTLVESLCARLQEQGEVVDFSRPGLSAYRYLSGLAQADAQADEVLSGAVGMVRAGVFKGEDGMKVLRDVKAGMEPEVYRRVGNALRLAQADAKRSLRELEPMVPKVLKGLEWYVMYEEGVKNRIFDQEGVSFIKDALTAMHGLSPAQMDVLAEVVQSRGGNEHGYGMNLVKAGNRGASELFGGLKALNRGMGAVALDVAGRAKGVLGGDGGGLRDAAQGLDEEGRMMAVLDSLAKGAYRPINRPEYGWFGNGVLSAVRSVPVTVLSFSGVGAGVAAMSYAGDSYAKAVQERPGGGRLARLGGSMMSGAAQGALERTGALVAKGVMGMRTGSAFLDRWMVRLDLSRQAMRAKSSIVRAGVRSGVAGGAVLGGEMVTEKLQDLADPTMQSLASALAGEAPGVDWERFWKDFTDRDQNMELFGSVLAFALVGAGARFTGEAGMQRQLSREYGKLKGTFGFSDGLLARMRSEPDDVARYGLLQDGIKDFMRKNYGMDVDGVKVGLGDRDGLRRLAERGGVRVMDVVDAAEAHANESERGVDEVRVEGAVVKDGMVEAAGNHGTVSGGVNEVGSGPVLSFNHQPVPRRKRRDEVDEKEVMRRHVEAVNDQLKEFGVSPIREEVNDFTEDVQFVVGLGEREEVFDSYDEAYEAVLLHVEAREDEVVAGLRAGLARYKDKGDGYVGAVQDEANEEMMRYLSDVGQDGRMVFDRSKMDVPMMLEQLKASGVAARRSAESRERIYAAQLGAEVGVDTSRLRVYAANVVKGFEDGRFSVASRLFRGANPFDVYEEWSEGMVKVLIRDSVWTVAEFEDELKRLEAATGEVFLVRGEGVDGLQAVCEGVSKAARAHLMGRIADERLPDKLRRWFKMFALLFARSFEFAQDLRVAKMMLGADVQAKMSTKFRSLLNDFAGFDEAAIAERARREEQAQIEAEVAGDMPEISVWAAGRLPHPKEAGLAGSDLTGELQRIYDALTTTRSAKGRRRKDGSQGRGFDQRVVVRAEQFFSREGRSVSDVLEAANEAGFDFADSGELLSAVYDSLVYGYKKYAARGEGQDVSFSLADRVRSEPIDEVRRVAAAFHGVEGMAPVVVDVPGAYEPVLKVALDMMRKKYRVLQERTQRDGFALVMGDGKRVMVSGKGWREVKQHAADRRVLAALAMLPELAGEARFIYSAENSEAEKKRHIERFHYYLVQADFKNTGEWKGGEAFVNFVLAEHTSGDLFYDLDASSVEEINKNREVSEVLSRSRVPNTGEAEHGTSHKGRVHLIKEFVNYVDSVLAGHDADHGLSVGEVEERGGFDEHGVLFAEDCVLVKPEGDLSMSIRALHASPHSGIRRFSSDKIGSGEGNQAFGWGLYFADNERVNNHYLKQFHQRVVSVLPPPVLFSVVCNEMKSGPLLNMTEVAEYIVQQVKMGDEWVDSVLSILADMDELGLGWGTLTTEIVKSYSSESYRRTMAHVFGGTIDLDLIQKGYEALSRVDVDVYVDEKAAVIESPASNYRAELNVDDDVLLTWEYVSPHIEGLLRDSPVDNVRWAIYHAQGRADDRGESASGHDVYAVLVDGFWDGDYDTKYEAKKAASLALLASGIKGIKYEDGFSRGKKAGKTFNYVIFDEQDIKITQVNDAETGYVWQDYEDADASFAMRMSHGRQSVWSYLAEVQGRAFEEEAKLYEAMQTRLESALTVNGFTRDGVYKDEKGAEVWAVQERMLAVMAVCDAVVTDLPRDVRGGIRPDVVAMYREQAMERKTWRGRMNAMMRMVKYVDWHIVNEGVKSRFKEFERFRKWAAASVGENRVRRGKMNVEMQRRLDLVERAIGLDADELEAAKNTAEARAEEMALIGGSEYDDAVEWVRVLDAFGGLYERNMHGRLTADLERVQGALTVLKELYAEGRLAHEAFWDDRRERVADLLDEAGKGVGRVLPVTVNERTGAAKHDVGVRRGVQNLMRGFLSFENLLEDVFGDGKVTGYFAEGVRRARLEYNDVRQKRVIRYYGALYRAARPEEYLKRADRRLDGQVRLGVRRVVDDMLRDLSQNRVWGIEVKMTGEFLSERIGIQDARAIAEGRMEAAQLPKWAKSDKAMDALKMALADLPATSKKEFVKFSWLQQGEELVEMQMSDLEAAYLLQMAEMPEYADNLEALGFDAEAIAKVRDHVDVRALRVAEYLSGEYEGSYGFYNEVYRRLFGCDLPKVSNYAPGFFVVDNAAEAVDPMESRGSGWINTGSIKMRRKHLALPRVVSCVNAYWAHSMQMDHWACFAEVMRDMKAVLLNGELGNKIEAVHGAQARRLLTGWVKDLEFDGSQNVGGAGMADQVVRRILGSMSQGALSGNLKTCLKQLPAMFSSLSDMSPGDAMRGFLGVLTNPKQLKDIWESPVIRQRLMQGMSPEMRQALTASRMSVSMLGDAVEAGMLPIGLADAAFTTFSGGMAFMAAKNKALKDGLDAEDVQEQALAAMDKAVRRTAQPIETEQRSPWEIHAGVLGRMMMLFRSDPRKQMALSYMAIAKWRRGEIGTAEAAWRFGQSWVVYGVLNQVIVEFLMWVMGKDDDDEELDLWDRWKGFVVSGAMGALAGVYGVAELVECTYSFIAGEKYYDYGNRLSGSVNSLWKGGEGLVNLLKGAEADYGKVMNQLGRGLNGTGVFAALGLPEFGAAAQVLGRVVKESKDVYGAWAHWWDDEAAKAQAQQRLIVETMRAEKKEGIERKEARMAVFDRVRGMDVSSRMEVYRDAGMDKNERRYMEERVKMAEASEAAKAVSRTKKENRKELVEKLKETMTGEEYKELVGELKGLGVRWK